MPSQDVWKFTPVSLWGRCPALTPLLQLITPSRASGTADHVQSLDDLFLYFFILSFFPSLDSEEPPLAMELIEGSEWKDEFPSDGSSVFDSADMDVDAYLKLVKHAVKKVVSSFHRLHFL